MKTLLIITAVIVGIALIYIFAFAILLWAFYDENYISGYDEFNATSRAVTTEKEYIKQNSHGSK